MLGSLYCMHWYCEISPRLGMASSSLGHDKKKSATIALEDVATQDLWICHNFFVLPGSLSDTRILDRYVDI